MIDKSRKQYTQAQLENLNVAVKTEGKNSIILKAMCLDSSKEYKIEFVSGEFETYPNGVSAPVNDERPVTVMEYRTAQEQFAEFVGHHQQSTFLFVEDDDYQKELALRRDNEAKYRAKMVLVWGIEPDSEKIVQYCNGLSVYFVELVKAEYADTNIQPYFNLKELATWVGQSIDYLHTCALVSENEFYPSGQRYGDNQLILYAQGAFTIYTPTASISLWGEEVVVNVRKTE